MQQQDLVGVKAAILQPGMKDLLYGLSKKLSPTVSGNHNKVRDALLDLGKQASKRTATYEVQADSLQGLDVPEFQCYASFSFTLLCLCFKGVLRCLHLPFRSLLL